MPSYSLPVGATTLPLAAGSSQQRIADPILDALLDFLAWSLGTDLNARLANLGGTSSTAAPTANRFAFDPTHPRGHSVKFTPPALFMWWAGTSEVKNWSTVKSYRERELSALYIFDELPHTDQLVVREGLFAAVDGCFAKASDLGRNPSYAYGSVPAGTPLIQSVGTVGTWAWNYIGGAGVQRIGIDDANTRNVGKRTSGRDYPAFAARFLVQEIIGPPTYADGADVGTDVSVTIEGGDGEESPDTTTILSGIAPLTPPE